EAGVHDDPVNPGGERGAPLEAPQVAPHLEEGVLDGVLGVVGVAQHLQRHGQRAWPRVGDQLREGLVVAPLGATEEIIEAGGSGGAGLLPTWLAGRWRFWRTGGRAGGSERRFHDA